MARTCWLNWGRVQPQLEELPLAVATVQLSPQLEQLLLVPLAWLVLLVLLVPLVPLVPLAWRVWPPPVAWLRVRGHP